MIHFLNAAGFLHKSYKKLQDHVDRNLKWFYLWIGSLKLLQHIWGKSHQFTVGIPLDLNLRYFINPCKMGYQSISYFKQTNNNYSLKIKWSKYRCTLTMTFYFPQSFSTKFSCYFHMADVPAHRSRSGGLFSPSDMWKKLF